VKAELIPQAWRLNWEPAGLAGLKALRSSADIEMLNILPRYGRDEKDGK